MGRATKQRLKVLRAERDLTQLDLALKAEISHNRYWHIENGYKLPTVDEVERLAKALGITKSEMAV